MREPAGRSGILLVDKPSGITSHDAVSRVRRLASTRKVGHAGTLDPLATGLLVLGINSSTRLLTFLVGLDKSYEATILLGFATTTDDAAGEPIGAPADTTAIEEPDIIAGIVALTGIIEQVPSSVSAIKVDGRRSYARVRAGEEVELSARTVTVSAFELVAIRRESGRIELDVRVDCSSGTYIRALARDLGSSLGTGGHLISLRRTRVGPFVVADARGLDESLLPELLSPASVATRLFPSIALTEEEVVELSHGKRIGPLAIDGVASDVPVAAVAPDGRLTGIVTLTDGVARVIVNFPSDEVLA